MSRFWFAVLLLAGPALPVHADNDPYGDPLPPGAKTRLGTIRYRVVGNYYPVLTPDGKTILASDNFSLHRYDVDGVAKGPVPSQSSLHPPIAISADGTRAVSSYHTTVVWEVATGKPLATLKRYIHYFDQGQPMASLSADGKVLALGGRDREGKTKGGVEVIVWDVNQDKEVGRFTPPQNEQALVAVSPDGKIVATWGQGSGAKGQANPEENPTHHVHFWEAKGKPLAKVRTIGFSTSAVVFSRDGKLAAVAGWSGIDLVDPRTGASKQLLLARSGVGRSLEFSPDGTTLFATSNTGLTQRWRVSDGVRLSTTEPPIAHLHTCSVRAISADRGVALALRGNTVLVWEVPSGKLLGPQDGHYATVSRLAVTPDSRFVFTSAHDGQALRWELATGKLVGPAPGYPWRGRFNPGGFSLAEFASGSNKALISDSGGYGVHDGITGDQEFVIPTGTSNSHSCAYTPDGSKAILCLGSHDGKQYPATVSVWDVAKAKRLSAIPLPGHSTFVAALTPDGKHLVTASRKPTEKGKSEYFLTAWETPGGAKKGEFQEEAGYVPGAITTAGDNSTAAVITSKGKLVRFDLATGKVEPIVCGIDTFGGSPVFNGDGKLVALLGHSPFGRAAPVAVFDWTTKKVRQTFACPDGGGSSAAFSPDGNHLITGTNKGTAFVWALSK